jgi:hypothetical protein
MRLALPLAVLFFAPALALATDLGPAPAGFDRDGFTLRGTLKATSSQYLLQADDGTNYKSSFAFAGAELAFGIQDRVRVLGVAGVGGFNAYDQPLTAPDGSYGVFGGGARVTLWRGKTLPAELGAGLNLTWWQREDRIASGEWTGMLGGALRLTPGNALYAGAQYYTIGSSTRPQAEVGGTVVNLKGDAPALYAGWELRLVVLSLRAEVRGEAPTWRRLGAGFSAGFDF